MNDPQAVLRAAAATRLPPSLASPPKAARPIGSRPWPAGMEQTWRLYRFWGYLPDGGRWWHRLVDALAGPRERLLYVGITGQYPPIARAFQHAVGKDWAAQVTRYEINPRIFPTEAAAVAAERIAIREERPLCNQLENEGNISAVHAGTRRMPVHVRELYWRRTRLLATAAALSALVWLLGGADRDETSLAVSGTLGVALALGARTLSRRRRPPRRAAVRRVRGSYERSRWSR